LEYWGRTTCFATEIVVPGRGVVDEVLADILHLGRVTERVTAPRRTIFGVNR